MGRAATLFWNTQFWNTQCGTTQLGETQRPERSAKRCRLGLHGPERKTSDPLAVPLAWLAARQG